MTTQHTPGPWEWKFDGKYCVGLEPNVIWVGREPTLDIEAANARLIAAAPELLEALKALQRQALQGNVRGDEWMDEALELTRAAIAKATGAA